MTLNDLSRATAIIAFQDCCDDKYLHLIHDHDKDSTWGPASFFFTYDTSRIYIIQYIYLSIYLTTANSNKK